MKVFNRWFVYITIEEQTEKQFSQSCREWAQYGYKPLFPLTATSHHGVLFYTQQWYRVNCSFVLFSSAWWTLKSAWDWTFRRGKWLKDNSPPEETSEE